MTTYKLEMDYYGPDNDDDTAGLKLYRKEEVYASPEQAAEVVEQYVEWHGIAGATILHSVPVRGENLVHWEPLPGATWSARRVRRFLVQS